MITDNADILLSAPLPRTRRSPLDARYYSIGQGLSLRLAEREDADVVLTLLDNFAEEKGGLGLDYDHRARLFEAGWNDPVNPRFVAWTIMRSELPVGLLIFATGYSTFVASPSLFLEDFYLKPQYRRQGIGSIVLESLVDLTELLGYGRFDLSYDSNDPALVQFYGRLAGVGSERKCIRISSSMLDTPRQS